MSTSESPSLPTVKALFFDFMGTCLDWCTTVSEHLPSHIAIDQRRRFALQWRVAYFRENEKRHEQGLPIEDIDETFTRALNERMLAVQIVADGSQKTFHDDALLDIQPFVDYFAHHEEQKVNVIRAWHMQKAWPDVAPALERVRERFPQCELFVHANGTTRLQLDLIKSSGLHFDMLMSSQMLGQLKPSPIPYEKGLQLIDRTKDEVVMVAAHVMDLRGAKAVGLRTIYIRRDTDDIHEDLSRVDEEFDVVLNDGMTGLADALARLQRAGKVC